VRLTDRSRDQERWLRRDVLQAISSTLAAEGAWLVLFHDSPRSAPSARDATGSYAQLVEIAEPTDGRGVVTPTWSAFMTRLLDSHLKRFYTGGLDKPLMHPHFHACLTGGGTRQTVLNSLRRPEQVSRLCRRLCDLPSPVDRADAEQEIEKLLTTITRDDNAHNLARFRSLPLETRLFGMLLVLFRGRSIDRAVVERIFIDQLTRLHQEHAGSPLPQHVSLTHLYHQVEARHVGESAWEFDSATWESTIRSEFNGHYHLLQQALLQFETLQHLSHAVGGSRRPAGSSDAAEAHGDDDRQRRPVARATRQPTAADRFFFDYGELIGRVLLPNRAVLSDVSRLLIRKLDYGTIIVAAALAYIHRDAGRADTTVTDLLREWWPTAEQLGQHDLMTALVQVLSFVADTFVNRQETRQLEPLIRDIVFDEQEFALAFAVMVARQTSDAPPNGEGSLDAQTRTLARQIVAPVPSLLAKAASHLDQSLDDHYWWAIRKGGADPVSAQCFRDALFWPASLLGNLAFTGVPEAQDLIRSALAERTAADADRDRDSRFPRLIAALALQRVRTLMGQQTEGNRMGVGGLFTTIPPDRLAGLLSLIAPAAEVGPELIEEWLSTLQPAVERAAAASAPGSDHDDPRHAAALALTIEALLNAGIALSSDGRDRLADALIRTWLRSTQPIVRGLAERVIDHLRLYEGWPVDLPGGRTIALVMDSGDGAAVNDTGPLVSLDLYYLLHGLADVRVFTLGRTQPLFDHAHAPGGVVSLPTLRTSHAHPRLVQPIVSRLTPAETHVALVVSWMDAQQGPVESKGAVDVHDTDHWKGRRDGQFGMVVKRLAGWQRDESGRRFRRALANQRQRVQLMRQDVLPDAIRELSRSLVEALTTTWRTDLARLLDRPVESIDDLVALLARTEAMRPPAATELSRVDTARMFLWGVEVLALIAPERVPDLLDPLARRAPAQAASAISAVALLLDVAAETGRVTLTSMPSPHAELALRLLPLAARTGSAPTVEAVLDLWLTLADSPAWTRRMGIAAGPPQPSAERRSGEVHDAARTLTIADRTRIKDALLRKVAAPAAPVDAEAERRLSTAEKDERQARAARRQRVAHAIVARLDMVDITSTTLPDDPAPYGLVLVATRSPRQAGRQLRANFVEIAAKFGRRFSAQSGELRRVKLAYARAGVNTLLALGASAVAEADIAPPRWFSPPATIAPLLQLMSRRRPLFQVVLADTALLDGAEHAAELRAIPGVMCWNGEGEVPEYWRHLIPIPDSARAGKSTAGVAAAIAEKLKLTVDGAADKELVR
jgi:hypothetical protein